MRLIFLAIPYRISYLEAEEIGAIRTILGKTVKTQAWHGRSYGNQNCTP